MNQIFIKLKTESFCQNESESITSMEMAIVGDFIITNLDFFYRQIFAYVLPYAKIIN